MEALGTQSMMAHDVDGTRLEWLGINGFRFRHHSRTLLLDPYVTRNPVSLCEPDVVQRHIPDADVIVISHSHWDHLADAHEIANRTGAAVIGSATTCHICSSLGVPSEQLIVAPAFSAIDCGDFSVTFLPSLHVTPVGGAVPYPGVYGSPPVTPPTQRSEYLEGGTFAVLFDFGAVRVLDVGSANTVEEHLQGLRPDVLLLSTAKWENTSRFVERVVGASQPSMIVPCHYDRMDVPLEMGLMDRDPGAMVRFQERVVQVAPSVALRVLGYFEEVVLSAGVLDGQSNNTGILQ